MSRIRQIKPSWFLDKELRQGTSADAREFYIGLWMLADDDGWLTWDEERIAAELYPYGGVAARERHVAKWAGQLERLNHGHPHLIVYDCGHAVVPKMKDHQRIAGKRTTRIHDDHQTDCRHAVSRLRLPSAEDGAGSSRGSRNGTVGNGSSSAGARDPSGDARPLSEFEAGVLAAGGVIFKGTH